MKKILLTLIGFFTLVSCSDPDTQTDVKNLDRGGYARFAGNPVLTADLASKKYVANLEDANSNIASYKVIEVSATIDGATYPAEAVDIPVTFPGEMSLDLDQLAQVFGLTYDDLKYGDSFKIVAEVTTKDGIVYNGYNAQTGGSMSADLSNPALGFKSAMNFKFTLACPSFDANAMIGTWSVTRDDFDFTLPSHTFQCVATNNANEFKFINFSDFGFDLIVQVNPAAQSVTVARQNAWDSAAFGLPYGIATVDGSGLIFSCIGQLNLNLTHRVTAGSFGAFPLVMTKQ